MTYTLHSKFSDDIQWWTNWKSHCYLLKMFPFPVAFKTGLHLHAFSIKLDISDDNSIMFDVTDVKPDFIRLEI